MKNREKFIEGVWDRVENIEQIQLEKARIAEKERAIRNEKIKVSCMGIIAIALIYLSWNIKSDAREGILHVTAFIGLFIGIKLDKILNGNLNVKGAE